MEETANQVTDEREPEVAIVTMETPSNKWTTCDDDSESARIKTDEESETK